jgi:molybdopterin biosynthesis enzyme MoaB
VLIRTGILCIPALDEAAIEAVRYLLRQSQAPVQIVLESQAQSQQHWIEEVLRRWSDEEEFDLVFTLGGTFPAAGPSAREIVPEATLAVVERLLPGLAEEMRACGRDQTPLALLDRGVAGVRGQTLIINLPAGANAAALFLSAIVDVLAPALAYIRAEVEAPQLADALAEYAAGGDGASVDWASSPRVSSPTGAGDKWQASEFAAFLKGNLTP